MVAVAVELGIFLERRVLLVVAEAITSTQLQVVTPPKVIPVVKTPTMELMVYQLAVAVAQVESVSMVRRRALLASPRRLVGNPFPPPDPRNACLRRWP